MANKTFDEFIERLASDVPLQDNGWLTIKDEWGQHVNTFFQMIQEYLQEYIDQGKVSVTYGAKTIIEEHLGKYETRTATVRIGSNEVILDPVGANIIGAKGRIDMLGPYGKVRFLLVDQKAAGPRIFRGEVPRITDDADRIWTWKLATEPPEIKYFDLDSDIFFEALMVVTNA